MRLIKGSSVIFNRDFCNNEAQLFEPFPGHTLSEEDRAFLRGFKEEAAEFAVAMEKVKLPNCPEIKDVLDRIRSAQAAYKIFVDQPPVHMRQVTPRFNEMKKRIKQCKSLTIDQKDQVLSYLHSAYDTLCAFFRISYYVRRRLLSDNPQLLRV